MYSFIQIENKKNTESQKNEINKWVNKQETTYQKAFKEVLHYLGLFQASSKLLDIP